MYFITVLLQVKKIESIFTVTCSQPGTWGTCWDVLGLVLCLEDGYLGGRF
jgi:hypothetical protein